MVMVWAWHRDGNDVEFSTSVSILDRRYVGGELNKEQYDQMRRNLA